MPDPNNDKLKPSHLVVRLRPTYFHEMLGIDSNDPESAEINEIIANGHHEITEMERRRRILNAEGLAKNQRIGVCEGGV